MRSQVERIHTRSTGRQIAGTVVSVVTTRVAPLLALHVLFVLVDLNVSNAIVNGIVEFVDDVAKSFVLGFEDVFTPRNEKAGVLLNYGFAAITYLVVGQLIARALQR